MRTHPQNGQASSNEADSLEPIAIVGMSCRFPGSVGPDAYYRSLLESRDLFSPPPRERWPWCGDERIFVPKIGALSGVFEFDNALFRISPREAETIDPHQRLMLEEVWLSIENAGYTHDDFKQSATGVFVAMYNQDFQFYARMGDWDEISRIYLAAGSAHCMAPNRISYAFDLRGPSEVVNTACSSALVAVHRAAEAIRNGECEQAIVGGVSLLLEPSRLLMLQDLGLLSPAGVCRPFDQDSSGQVLGEGVAALVLKPLDSALRDRDAIHALILGSGVNHQGMSSGGLTRPSAVAQAELIRRTYLRGGRRPGAVSYVEAHGNGGDGDLSELLAFQEVFDDGIHLGSVKGNIGFLEAAGGLSQIIKLVMTMRRGVVPATRSHQRLIKSDKLRPGGVRIVQENTPIENLNAGREESFCAAAHAYGLGGCNAHILLSEPPARVIDETPALPILLSGEDPIALSRYAAHLLESLQSAPHASVADISFTLAVGRPQKSARAALYATSREDLARRLRGIVDNVEMSGRPKACSCDAGDAAIQQWLDGAEVSWSEVLPHGRRTALVATALRRRSFPMPPIVARST